MSYHRKPLSGVQSRAYGSRVARRSLDGIQSRQYGSRIGRGALGGLFDSIDPPFPPVFQGDQPADDMDEGVWRKNMLASQENQTLWMASWVRRDAFQRWLQLAATLSIPLAALVWKALLKRRSMPIDGV